jgi:murein DD-endopeptidase MepM/ murein hydrolase activator NlpD
LLSALILASTASVRSSLADGAAQPVDPPEPSGAVSVLTLACQTEGTTGSCDASYAAELLRWEAGYISMLPNAPYQTRGQRVDAAFTAADRLLHSSIAPDWDAWHETLAAFNPGVYDAYARNAEAFSALAEAINLNVQYAAGACMRGISRDMRAVKVSLAVEALPETRLTWRECAALYFAFGEGMTGAMADALAAERTGTAPSGVTVRWPNPSFDAIAACGTHDQHVEAIFALDYLNTVYNEDGSDAPVETPQFSEEYLATVTHPVPGGVIKDGWFDNRSRNTRLHVGTDIRMRARTPILSMTDGVVKFIGYLPIPGNYVIIEDPYGYTYHYYHMYEPTAFVKEGDTVRQGQQIGIVGSTGNSETYHLHVGLVSPEGKYLNPYELFLQAGIGPLLKNG